MSKKITELTALSTPGSADLLPVVDMTGPTTKKSTVSQLAAVVAGLVTIAESQVTSLVSDLAARALTSLNLTAGGGLTGGGDLSTNRTFAVGAGTGISVNADDVAVNYGTTGVTACAGNDARLSDSRAPNGTAGGDLSGTYPNPTVANLPNDVVQAGDLLVTAIAAPSTPTAGKARVYVDSTSKNIAVKDDAGVVKHGVKTKAAVSNSFATAIDDDGTVTVAQPTDANLSTSDITTNDATTSKHGFVVKATAPAANVLNVVGIANGETSYTNKTLFDGTNPAALGTAAPGTSLSAAHRDHVHSATIAAIIGTGTTTLQGLLDISGASAGQIQFPATQNASSGANVLDDYEEGSWTPSVGGSTSQSGQAYSIQVGRYIKIGKQVSASFHITMSTLGTMTGQVQIQGMPFTADSVTNLAWSANWGYTDSWNVNIVSMGGLALPSTTAMFIYHIKTGTPAPGYSTTAQADLTNNFRVYGTFNYQADA